MTDKEMETLVAYAEKRSQVICEERAMRREAEDSLVERARANWQTLKEDIKKYYIPVFAHVVDCCALADVDLTVGYVSADPASPEYRSVLSSLGEIVSDYELRVIFSEDCDSGYLTVDCGIIDRKRCVYAFRKGVFSCAADMTNDVIVNDMDVGNDEVAFFACLDPYEVRPAFARWARDALDGEFEVACRETESARKDLQTLAGKEA